jgi:HD-GYP domain-containing protein (c-di-GMP phosphodiesterase class II)
MPKKKLQLLSRLDSVSTRFLINALDKADPRSLEHGLCVAEVSHALGDILDHPRYSASQLWLAGLFHDIGLLGVPKEITDKKGKLTKAQRRYVEQHPKLGKFLIGKMFNAPEIAEAILCHHERPDGKGYPMKFSGDEIPFMARVIAVADSYDTMRGADWLFKRKSHDDAVRELKKGVDKQFDRDVVKAFNLNHDPIYVSYEKAKSITIKQILRYL